MNWASINMGMDVSLMAPVRLGIVIYNFAYLGKGCSSVVEKYLMCPEY